MYSVSTRKVCREQFKFSDILHTYMSTNDCESVMSIDLSVRNEFWKEGKFGNTDGLQIDYAQYLLIICKFYIICMHTHAYIIYIYLYRTNSYLNNNIIFYSMSAPHLLSVIEDTCTLCQYFLLNIQVNSNHFTIISSVAINIHAYLSSKHSCL